MSTQTVASAAAALRNLIDGMQGAFPVPLRERLYKAADALEAAAEGSECPRCTDSREAALAALRSTIAAALVRSAGRGCQGLATDIAETILAAGLAKDGAR